MNEVVTRPAVGPVAAPIDEATIDQFLFTSNTRLNPQQKTLFLRLAQEFNLNPFRREIHCIAYGTEFSVVTAYNVYLARAEATQKLNGWDCRSIWEGEGQNRKLKGAEITIWRKDFDKPFTWEVSFRDFAKKKADGSLMGSWAKMPEFMIKKVAVGQGFRLAFPNELGSLPYLPEEIGSEAESGMPLSGLNQEQKQETSQEASNGKNADS